MGYNIFDQTLSIAAGGMSAQSIRLKIITENIANASSTSMNPSLDPYRRKQVFFKEELDQKMGVKKVVVSRVLRDMGVLPIEYNPLHPGADENGNVKKTNVEPLIEVMDAKIASTNHGASLKMYEVAYDSYLKTISLLT